MRTRLVEQARDGDDVAFGPIPGVPDPGFGLGPNALNRLIVVRVGGHQVVIGLRAETVRWRSCSPSSIR